MIDLNDMQIRTLGTLMAEAQMFEKHTRRRPDAVMIPGSHFGPPVAFPLRLMGAPVFLGDRLALIYNVEAGE